ncbi:MAG: cupin domain-containing protein [Anaerolineales bacterium]|nr:cupin domain-containing protein [Anaerolineales bacterium]
MNELTDQNPSEIGRKLWSARQKQKMSLRDLAKAAEISASMLSQIETGKAFPSVRSLYKIAAALGVSVDYFFPAEDEQPNDAASNGATHSTDLTASQMREALLTNDAGNGMVSFPTTHKTPVVQANARPKLELNSGITWARLTANSEEDTEFLEIKYAPGAQSGKNMSSHSGREFGLVLEGELMVELGFETFTLSQGDSIIFDSSTPHRLTNNGTLPMRALWVVLTPNNA